MSVYIGKKSLKKIIGFILVLAIAGYGSIYIKGAMDSQLMAASAEGDWGLSFQEKGAAPVGNATSDYLRQFDARYIGDEKEKKVYLTFDAGYDNGYTAHILDVLKKNNVKAAFFVVGNFIEDNPELVRRMAEDGHIVGNHTYSHPDMAAISDKGVFKMELEKLENAYEDVTGKAMKRYYRPPQGRYSESNLKMAKDMGYKTVFWSLAYVDWYEDNQPDMNTACEKLTERLHNGAIILLHSTSETNSQILDSLIKEWKDMGYAFESIDKLY